MITIEEIANNIECMTGNINNLQNDIIEKFEGHLINKHKGVMLNVRC